MMLIVDLVGLKGFANKSFHDFGVSTIFQSWTMFVLANMFELSL